ncbi:hypothetical protein A3J34_02535 [Candidatus Peribacteria bacterium RIFCSPLOWO2_02_FULL_51_10]|nr:MAG: hypothetical protein A3J34_02535 [Candidatus Peribacteria bacterium RIFCSPLOWO2_02_FULL_51_10]
MDSPKLTIDDIREAIDEADKILLKALGARYRAVRYLGQFKKLMKLPMADPGRERRIKEAWKKQAKKLELSEEFALLILDFILSESKRIQKEA